jgi:hypothetical protein
MNSTRWEYETLVCNVVVSREYPLFVEQLRQLGDKGFELIAIYNGNLFIFKRSVPTS